MNNQMIKPPWHTASQGWQRKTGIEHGGIRLLWFPGNHAILYLILCNVTVLHTALVLLFGRLKIVMPHRAAWWETCEWWTVFRGTAWISELWCAWWHALCDYVTITVNVQGKSSLTNISLIRCIYCNTTIKLHNVAILNKLIIMLLHWLIQHFTKA